MAKQYINPTHFGDDRGGRGLHLRVSRSSGGVTETFQRSATLRGKQSTVEIGTYPQITLSAPREKAIANFKIVRDEEEPHAS